MLREPSVTPATKRTQRLHGVSIEPRNVYIAGAETVQKVERNMCNAASARRCRPAGVEEHITCKKGMYRKLGDPASDQWHNYALVRIGKVRSRSR